MHIIYFLIMYLYLEFELEVYQLGILRIQVVAVVAVLVVMAVMDTSANLSAFQGFESILDNRLSLQAVLANLLAPLLAVV